MPAVTLATFADMFGRTLVTADHLLTKGAAFAESQGADAESILDWRLYEDMQPLRYQIMVICDFTQQWPARVAGLPVPDPVTDELDIPGFRAALAASRAWLAALPSDAFAGRDEVPLTYTMGTGMTLTLPSAQWLTGFATTNLYFHLTTAYAILRARGAPLGKVDMFAGGL
ncbi:DUF1993 domain-containing protein [Phenylobacterium aquaticum]|uniref:DUF1993 domain-containing protein n=1 Tax=Phenylobacterium aquaticum TaxID=1763816 RepID=UPI001F5CC7C0|nr:DUF1993 domain-containing protein [Phenylobacterium aquaticum]MCI3135540.1 DUF1993 domain-containing protein [Phenylobacterium aquaticum]